MFQLIIFKLVDIVIFMTFAYFDTSFAVVSTSFVVCTIRFTIADTTSVDDFDHHHIHLVNKHDKQEHNSTFKLIILLSFIKNKPSFVVNCFAI